MVEGLVVKLKRKKHSRFEKGLKMLGLKGTRTTSFLLVVVSCIKGGMRDITRVYDKWALPIHTHHGCGLYYCYNATPNSLLDSR